VIIFFALGARLVFVHVIRHLLWVLVRQFLNHERLLRNPRDIQVCVECKKDQLSYFVYGWEDTSLTSNNIDRTIYKIEWMLKGSEEARERLKSEHRTNFVEIPFEQFVADPVYFVDQVSHLQHTERTRDTKMAMKEQKLPRTKIFDGPDLAIYLRSGPESRQSDLSQREEFVKRGEFAIPQGATKPALAVLDRLCRDYESKGQMEWKI